MEYCIQTLSQTLDEMHSRRNFHSILIQVLRILSYQTRDNISIELQLLRSEEKIIKSIHFKQLI